MKKLFMLSSAALLMASCTSDGLVNPNGGENQSNESPMTFVYRSLNTARGENDLNNEEFDFGVWAVKANDDTELKGTDMADAATTNVVMKNYCVGYFGADGYDADAAGNTTTAQSNWFYEGLGQDYDTKTIAAGYKTTSPSNLASQYLKYWDGSFTNTYFIGYTPYINGTNTPVVDLSVPKISFQEAISVNDSHSYMYAATRAINAQYLGTGAEVPMQFHRLLSRIRIAIYEEIPGYTVEMADFKFDGKTETFGVAAMTVNAAGDDFGHIVYSGKPEVEFDFSGAGTAYPTTGTTTSGIYTASAINYKECTTGLNQYSQFLNFATPTGAIGTSNGTKTLYETVYNVLPNNGTNIDGLAAGDDVNTGLQFVMSFTLKSEDNSGETILVKNARVTVPATDTQWAANTCYTYVFKITTGVGGTTTPDDPDPTPDDPDQALYPIIFDDVIAVPMTPVEHGDYEVAI